MPTHLMDVAAAVASQEMPDAVHLRDQDKSSPQPVACEIIELIYGADDYTCSTSALLRDHTRMLLTGS
jgi:hypothetical protein